MKIMLRAAIAAVSLASIGPAIAGDGEGPVANTQFTSRQGVVAQADVPNAAAYAQNGQAVQQAQNGQGTHTYVTRSGHGTWLFAPNPNGGSNS